MLAVLRPVLISAFSVFICTQALAFSRFEGGVSGGGGNVINPAPPDRAADHEDVEHIVKASVSYTYWYFKSVQGDYISGQMKPELSAIFTKIFAGGKDFESVLTKVQPDVQEEGPCHDFDYKPVDASIRSSRANSFCVSSYAIANKVNFKEIPIQSAALMAHEYSEIMGLNEEEAVSIQKNAIERMKASNLPPLSVNFDEFWRK